MTNETGPFADDLPAPEAPQTPAAGAHTTPAAGGGRGLTLRGRNVISPSDHAELEALQEARKERDAQETAALISTGWDELRRLHDVMLQAGRTMLLIGVRALQLKGVLPYGEFNRQLASRCPEISRRSLYRSMQAARHVISLLPGFGGLDFQFGHSGTTDWNHRDALSHVAGALAGEAWPEVLAEIDALIEGKSGRQLVLEAKQADQGEGPEIEEEFETWCLTFFESDVRGPECEARWRMAAEAGEISWGDCKRNCVAGGSERTDLNSTVL